MHHPTNSDHTILSADGARVSFVTAKQTEAEIFEYNAKLTSKSNLQRHNDSAADHKVLDNLEGV